PGAVCAISPRTTPRGGGLGRRSEVAAGLRDRPPVLHLRCFGATRAPWRLGSTAGPAGRVAPRRDATTGSDPNVAAAALRACCRHWGQTPFVLGGLEERQVVLDLPRRDLLVVLRPLLLL